MVINNFRNCLNAALHLMYFVPARSLHDSSATQHLLTEKFILCTEKIQIVLFQYNFPILKINCLNSSTLYNSRCFKAVKGDVHFTMACWVNTGGFPQWCQLPLHQLATSNAYNVALSSGGLQACKECNGCPFILMGSLECEFPCSNTAGRIGS